MASELRGAREDRRVSDSTDTLLAAVEQVARLAGDIALGFFQSPLVVESKADGTPVTIADRSAEQGARDWIEQRFPLDGILGEELGLTRPKAPRRWVLDPIDGTKTYIRGVPLWGTLVGVCEGERRARRCGVLSGCRRNARGGTLGRLLVEWGEMPGILACNSGRGYGVDHRRTISE